MAKPPVIVLSSGGLRSLLCTALAARDNRIAMLHFKDHRVTSAQALVAFDKQAAQFKPFKTLMVDAGYFRTMSLPPETAGLVTSTGSDPQSALIPLREMQMLTIAAGYARQLKAGAIFWGAHFDNKNADAMARNMEFVQVFNQMLELENPDPVFTVRTPLMGLEDHQMIELGYQMNVPFAASWTCQMARETPCMSCTACSRRIRAFRAAQLADPLVVKKPMAMA